MQTVLTAETVDLIAELYFICDRDRKRMQTELVNRGIYLNGGGSLDNRRLFLPQVRRAIVEKAREMRKTGLYSREQHVQKLQEIRDRALSDDNFKVGLAAEIAVGKAAGLYENIDEDAPETVNKLMPPENMTTDQIKARIAELQAKQLPAPDTIPESRSTPINRDQFAGDLDDDGFKF